MDPNQLREHVISPVLTALGLRSEAAELLVLGTACQESNLRYLKQLGKGPAWGIYQMEPNTHDDIWGNWLRYNSELAEKVLGFNIPGLYDGHDYKEMGGNLYYATAMCRIHYRRVKAPLPAADDLPGMARYWKQYYNTPKGKGTTGEFISNFRKYSGVKL